MSGSTIGGFVGAGIGFLVSGGNPAGARWGWMIGSAVGGYVDPEQIQGPRLQDARTQTSRDGVPIPFGWGTFPLMGNIIAQGPVREHEKTESQGKGGPEVTNYTYTRTYAVGLCEGPITGVLQVKRNGKVVYDARTDEDLLADIARELQGVELTGFIGSTFVQIAAAIRAANSRFDNKVTFYLGDETQMPDPALEAIFGAGKVNAHRGLAYFVVEDDDVTDTAGAIPQFEVVVVRDGEVGQSVSGGEIVPGRLAEFVDRDFPLPDSLDQYTYTGVIGINVGGGSSATYSGSSIQEVIDYFTNYAYPSGSRAPVHYIGYSANTDTITPDIGMSVSLSRSNPQPSVVDNYELCLVYNDLVPDSYHSALWSFSCSVDDSFVQCDGRGTVAKKYPSAPNGQYRLMTSCPGGDLYGTYPLVIVVRRKRSCPVIAPSEGAMPIPDAPGFYVDSGGAVSAQNQYTQVTGTYRALALATTALVDGRRQYTNYETGPIVASDDANYGSEAFWTAAYNASVSAGTLPSGWVYGVNYPAPVASACRADQYFGDTIAPNPTVLATIVADVCERRGLVAAEYDVSQLTDLVPGFVVGRETDAASIIQSLAPAYFFDPAEWDGKLRFIKRGGAAVASINGDDLVERDGDAFERERVQEAELLRRVTVAYNDPLAGYAPTTQKWERRAGTVQALGEASVELPLTLAADDAATIAKRRALTAWGEPEKQKFSLPYRLAKLTPTDVINYTDDDGVAHTLRLMDLQDDSGVRYVESSANRAEAYGATASGVLPAAPSLTDPSLRGPTLLAVMDLPLWRGSDADTLGLYVAARGYLSGWQGAAVAVSTESGVSYTDVTQITQQAAIGTTTTALAADVSSEYQSVQSITVTLPRAPESVSYESLLRYNNRAALQLDSGAWEILQYQTVVAVDTTTFTLSGLVRGRYATTPGAAAAGATFVLLDAAVQFVPVERHLLGSTVKARATTFGTSSDAAVPADVAFTAGASQSEWPVHNVIATRDVSDNVTVSWIGRARLGTETAPYHSANFAGYRVSWDDGTTVATADTTGTTYTITAAADPIDVTVTPLNSITGAGPASEVITV